MDDTTETADMFHGKDYIAPLKVLRMKDDTWIFDIASDITTKTDFPKHRSEYESIHDMPDSVRDKLAMLLHLPVMTEVGAPRCVMGIGSRPDKDVFWVYLNRADWLSLHKLP